MQGGALAPISIVQQQLLEQRTQGTSQQFPRSIGRAVVDNDDLQREAGIAGVQGPQGSFQSSSLLL